jgi:hypothetical protein
MVKQIVISGCLAVCLLMGLGSVSGAASGSDAETLSGSVTLSWDAPPPPVRGYKISYGTKADGPYVEIDVGPVPPWHSQVYTVHGLQPNTRYYFKVRAFNDAGLSPFSNQVAGITR